jgi:hypothetical protein
MRTLGIWLLLLLASQSIFAENTITIIGDTDDGYYFQSACQNYTSILS